jgi:hypothetical protein
MTTPPPDPELKRQGATAGHAASEEHTQDSVLGPGVVVVSDESFEWLDGGYFLVSIYDTKFGGEPAQKGVNYWATMATRDASARLFSNNGSYTEDGNPLRGVVQDSTLTFRGPARFQYRLDDAGKVRVNDDGTISVAWWLRDENGE